MARKTTNIADPLRERRQQLVAELEQINRRSVSREDLAVETAADELDQTRLFADRDIVAQELSNDYARAIAIREALDRMDEGTYGECLECGEPISPRRLNALPWAAHCVACQEEIETREGGAYSSFRTTLDTAA